MKNIPKFLLVLSLVGVTSFLTSCGESSLEIGMMETNLPGRWEASYVTFTGTKVDTIRAQAGQVLELEYDVEMDKGELSIEVGRHDREAMWDASLQKDTKDSVTIALDQDGPYQIVVEGDDAGGSFDLSWALR